MQRFYAQFSRIFEKIAKNVIKGWSSKFLFFFIFYCPFSNLITHKIFCLSNHFQSDNFKVIIGKTLNNMTLMSDFI